jgi:hypothetical protein
MKKGKNEGTKEGRNKGRKDKENERKELSLQQAEQEDHKVIWI